MMKKTFFIPVLIILIFTSFLLRICYAPTESITSVSHTPEVYSATIMAVGDNLVHNTVYYHAAQSDGTYNFDFLFENIKNQITAADISVINQETIIVDDNSKISNYPVFGTPAEMTDAISRAGFDVVLHATNHAYDKGIYGVNSSINLWKRHPDVHILGIHESPEQANEITVINRNGISFSMLNFTYGLNGFVLPPEYSYAIDLLTDKEKVISDVRRAESLCDVNMVFMHIGEENTFAPTDYEISYINDIIDAGADIVICSHSHTLQPYNMTTTQAGNKAVVFYSLGNFHSDQIYPSQLLGGMANVTVQKTVNTDGSSEISIESYSLTPLVTHFDGTYRSTIPLSDYTEPMSLKHRISGMKPDKLWDLFNSIINN